MATTEREAPSKGPNTIARYVRLEKRIGRSGDWARIARVANHVARACRLYGYKFNPY